MQGQDFEIVRYSDNLRDQVLDTWEESVLTTHEFLKAADFQSIKEIVNKIDFNAFDVCCLTQNTKVAGFIGVASQKVEMLFLSPQHMGKGLGKKLMNFAATELKADKVDVNEQNTNAVQFYRRFGFKTYERADKDDQGNAYPLLRMKLEAPVNS